MSALSYHLKKTELIKNTNIKKTCTHCHGQGEFEGEPLYIKGKGVYTLLQPCSHCAGTGHINTRIKIRRKSSVERV